MKPPLRHGLLVIAVVGGLAPRASADETPATVDTLDVHTILERHSAKLDSLLLPTSVQYDTAGVAGAVDSLDRGGAVEAHRRRRIAAGSPGPSLNLSPLALTTYDRVDGLRLGTGIEPSWGRLLRADVAAAYGFSSHEWAGRAALEIGKTRGPLGRVAWSDLVVPFGPLPGGESLGFLALVAGQDRQDYLRRRELAASFWPWRQERLRVGLRVFDRRDESRPATTDFSFVSGNVPMNDPNPQVDALHAQGIALLARRGRDEDRAWIEAEVGVAGGDVEWSWQDLRLYLAQIVPGGTLSLRLDGANRAGTPPVQEVAYLGGDDNLRGFERLEFLGKRRATARVEYALGIDLLARTHIPIIEKAHVQFIPWADVGTTWGETRAVTGSLPALEGDARASFGLGLRRTLWLPGFLAVRLDIAHRTDGADDPWGFWFRAVPIDF
jgi:hypothetical protein